MTKKKGLLDFISENTFIHILLSIVLGFLVGAIFLAIMGLSVGAAYGRLISSVTSLKGFSYVVVYSVPYIVAGLSVAFPSRRACSTSAQRASSSWAPWRRPSWAFCCPTCPSPCSFPCASWPPWRWARCGA